MRLTLLHVANRPFIFTRLAKSTSSLKYTPQIILPKREILLSVPPHRANIRSKRFPAILIFHVMRLNQAVKKISVLFLFLFLFSVESERDV